MCAVCLRALTPTHPGLALARCGVLLEVCEFCYLIAEIERLLVEIREAPFGAAGRELLVPFLQEAYLALRRAADGEAPPLD